MTLRLQGTTGFTEVKAPAAAGNNTITLPTGNGSANQFLKSGDTAGTLEFATHRGFATYAVICDQKAYDEEGGTFTQDAWQTRELNTEITDSDSIVSISSNQFTLSSAGNYFIEAFVPGYRVNRHVSRLQNITTSTTVQVGTAEYADSGNNVGNKSVVLARVSLTGSTTFEIQHYAQTTNPSNGFGVNTDISGVNSIYTVVKIYKEA